jgi:hypothetical protein
VSVLDVLGVGDGVAVDVCQLLLAGLDTLNQYDDLRRLLRDGGGGGHGFLKDPCGLRIPDVTGLSHGVP